MRLLRRRPPAVASCPHCGGRAVWAVTGFSWDDAAPATSACETHARHLEREWGPVMVRKIS